MSPSYVVFAPHNIALATGDMRLPSFNKVCGIPLLMCENKGRFIILKDHSLKTPEIIIV